VRFDLNLPVRYRSADGEGCGQILNMSSSGALFTAQHALPKGSEVELCVQWPVLLMNAAHLMLVAAGRVVREEPGRVALRIQRYEFRTCSPAYFMGAMEPTSYIGAGLEIQISDDAVQ
jgi:PilZ domain